VHNASEALCNIVKVIIALLSNLKDFQGLNGFLSFSKDWKFQRKKIQDF